MAAIVWENLPKDILVIILDKASNPRTNEVSKYFLQIWKNEYTQFLIKSASTLLGKNIIPIEKGEAPVKAMLIYLKNYPLALDREQSYSNQLKAVHSHYLKNLKSFSRSASSSDIGSTLDSTLSEERASALISQRTLFIQNENLEILPDEIKYLTSLETLFIGGCNLKMITPQIGMLSELTSLNLTRNQIVTIPQEIGKLPLVTLILDNNLIVDIPDGVYNLKSLTSLSLTKNQIRKISPKIAFLFFLQTLFLDDNPLETLPAEIRYLHGQIHLPPSVKYFPRILLKQLPKYKPYVFRIDEDIEQLKSMKDFSAEECAKLSIPLQWAIEKAGIGEDIVRAMLENLLKLQSLRDQYVKEKGLVKTLKILKELQEFDDGKSLHPQQIIEAISEAVKKRPTSEQFFRLLEKSLRISMGQDPHFKITGFGFERFLIAPTHPDAKAAVKLVINILSFSPIELPGSSKMGKKTDAKN